MADLNAGKGYGGQTAKERRAARSVDRLPWQDRPMIDKINAGQGTIGRLLVDPQLYDTLNGATREMQN